MKPDDAVGVIFPRGVMIALDQSSVFVSEVPFASEGAGQVNIKAMDYPEMDVDRILVGR
jgi:hypothetical protein